MISEENSYLENYFYFFEKDDNNSKNYITKGIYFDFKDNKYEFKLETF